MRNRTPVEVRLWAKVDTMGPWSEVCQSHCWLWTGALTKGYGSFYPNGPSSKMKAHRAMYEHLVGPIPEGLVIDHLCRVRRCVRPDHLEPVTNAENTRRGETGLHNPVKTHCPKGHEYTEANTYRNPTTSKRHCRTCNRVRHRV